jgi:hypothetical protein
MYFWPNYEQFTRVRISSCTLCGLTTTDDSLMPVCLRCQKSLRAERTGVRSPGRHREHHDERGAVDDGGPSWPSRPRRSGLPPDD